MMLKRKLFTFLVALAMAATVCATVSTNPGRNEYTATGGQTIFNYTFKIYSSSDLNVYQTPTGQEPSDSADIITGYTVAGIGEEAGGSITLDSGATADDKITIVSAIPTNRTTDYQFNGDFRPDVVNADFDRVVSIVKQNSDTVTKALRYQESDQSTAPTLPAPVPSTVIGYNASGGIANLTLGVDGNSWDGLADLASTDSGKGSGLVGWEDNVGETVTDALTTLSGLSTKAAITSDDTTPSYLDNKIVGKYTIQKNILTPAGDEQIEIAPQRWGCRLIKDVPKTVGTATPTTLAWATEIYDDDNFFDVGTANFRMVIPVGVSKIKARAQIAWVTNGVANSRLINIELEGVDTEGESSVVGVIGSGTIHMVETGVIDVNTGDAVAVIVTQDTGIDADITVANTWFELEVIE